MNRWPSGETSKSLNPGLAPQFSDVNRVFGSPTRRTESIRIGTLKKRYAKGEITKSEFEEMKKDLEG